MRLDVGEGTRRWRAGGRMACARAGGESDEQGRRRNTPRRRAGRVKQRALVDEGVRHSSPAGRESSRDAEAGRDWRIRPVKEGEG